MTTAADQSDLRRATMRKQLKRAIFRNWELYLFLVPAVVFVFIFNYIPIYGLQVAFKNLIAGRGVWSGTWVGLRNFQRFFNMYNFWQIFGNTLAVSFYEIVAGFPIPIVLALLLNQVTDKSFKRIAQTVTLAPFFISVVVLIGLFYTMMHPDYGIINILLSKLGFEKIFFFGEAAWGRSLYVWTGIWQNAGWGAIIYLAALTALDVEVMEAATIDGATKLQKVMHIEIPTILPTISIMLIMRLGHVMDLGAAKMLLIRNNMNISATQIIATYVYEMSLVKGQYEFGTAVSIFNTVINFSMLLLVNWISGKLSDNSLF